MPRTKRNPELSEALNLYKTSLFNQSLIDLNANKGVISQAPFDNNGLSAMSRSFPTPFNPNQNVQTNSLSMNTSLTNTTNVNNTSTNTTCSSSSSIAATTTTTK